MVYNTYNEMKYILSTITLALGIIGFSTISYAQTPKPAVVAPQALFDANANAPLTVRKQYVETNLRTLLGTLNSMYTRVQVASNRLRTNGIDTAVSDTKLALAQTALMNAKVNLDLFAAVPVDTKPATVTTLRAHAKASEDNLKDARTAIIESISTLQLTLLNQ